MKKVCKGGVCYYVPVEKKRLRQTSTIKKYNKTTEKLRKKMAEVNKGLLQYARGKVFTPVEFYELQVLMGDVAEDFGKYYYQYRNWEYTQDMRQEFDNLLGAWKRINPKLQTIITPEGEIKEPGQLFGPKKLKTSDWEREELESFLDEMGKIIEDPREFEFFDVSQIKKEEDLENLLRKISEQKAKKRLEQIAAMPPSSPYPLGTGGFRRKKPRKKMHPPKDNNNDRKKKKK
jgi:hypothetical protein